MLDNTNMIEIFTLDIGHGKFGSPGLVGIWSQRHVCAFCLVLFMVCSYIIKPWNGSSRTDVQDKVMSTYIHSLVDCVDHVCLSGGNACKAKVETEYLQGFIKKSNLLFQKGARIMLQHGYMQLAFLLFLISTWVLNAQLIRSASP